MILLLCFLSEHTKFTENWPNMNKELNLNNERQPYQTVEDIIKQAKETLLTYHWHKPTIILEGSIKTITGNFRELIPNFSAQIQQMLEAGIEVGKNQNAGVVEQAFFISELTQYDVEENVCLEIKSERKELLQVSHCSIRDKRVTTKVFIILYDKDTVIGFQDYNDEENPMLGQDKALIDSFLRGYLQGRISSLSSTK
jgi:hypothetical protein